MCPLVNLINLIVIIVIIVTNKIDLNIYETVYLKIYCENNVINKFDQKIIFLYKHKCMYLVWYSLFQSLFETNSCEKVDFGSKHIYLLYN